MEIVATIEKMREHVKAWRAKGKSIAFVPTMGGLHRGHVALMEKARSSGDVVVLSSFLNPKQFNDPEDFEKYPRDLDQDKKIARKNDVDVFFAPTQEEMYPPGFLTTVNVSYLSRKLEGEFRPGHFRGVCTVVMKLLSIVEPQRLILGLKDAQQFVILEHMIADLAMDIDVIGVPTVRDPDGLALSTRNGLLTKEQRQKALCMSRALRRVHFLVRKQGILHAGELLGAIRSTIDTAGADLEYADIVSRSTLEPLDHVVRGGTFVLLAIKVGDVRLIDNTRI